MTLIILATYLIWDPQKTAFIIPGLNHPVAWYGLLFVSGFILGYLVAQKLIARTLNVAPFSETAIRVADKLLWCVVFGAVIGARLGHVLFYDLNYYLEHPTEIFMTWHGGLASHGGAIGIVIALFICSKSMQKTYPSLTFLRLSDIIAIPAALGGMFIRFGNFINQEIVGTASNLPWAILFLHPVEGGPLLPRHPVQLYEAIAYFIIFGILYSTWKRNPDWAAGKIAGLFFILVFSARFFLEFFKSWQASPITIFHLQAGQLLSIPFILIGFYLFYRNNLGLASYLLGKR